MKIEKKTFHIKGMHCKSCEILIREELSKLPDVEKVNVSEKKGTAELLTSRDITNQEIEDKIIKYGYTVNTNKVKSSDSYLELLKIAGVLFAVYLFAKNIGIFNLSFINPTSEYTPLFIILMGLTAGFSTCMALVGGLVLGVSIKYSQEIVNMDSISKFKPHLYFNIGRIIFFLIFGALIGLFGSIFQLSATSIGILTILVGFVMLILGLKTLNLVPVLNKINITIPNKVYDILGISKIKDKHYTNNNAFLLGGLTFFLPCGFTQAMQIYAVSTGSSLKGALTMGLFALGTTPGLLSIGGLASFINGGFKRTFVRIVGLILIPLSIYNINNGLNLGGFKTKSISKSVTSYNILPKTNTNSNSDVQIIKATYTQQGDLQPNEFTVSANKPVIFEIDSKDNGYGCMGSIALPGLTKNYDVFRKNQKIVFNFTPLKTGIYQITCAMGIPRGNINVQ